MEKITVDDNKNEKENDIINDDNIEIDGIDEIHQINIESIKEKKKREEKERKRKQKYEKLFDRYENKENERSRDRLLINLIHVFDYKFRLKGYPQYLKYPMFVLYSHKNNVFMLNEKDYNFLMGYLGYNT
ncbi:MAG: hypothetical protein WC554_02065 [Clostridia bacterium]